MSVPSVFDAVLAAIDGEFAELQARRDVAHPDNHATFADYLRHLAAGERATADLYARLADVRFPDPPRRIVVTGLRTAQVTCRQRAAMYDQAADRNPTAGPDDDTWKARS